jgi:hypothetical protein
MTSHFKTGRFGRGPTEQRPRLSPTRTGGRSLRSEGRIDYESEATHDPTGGGLLFPSTYYKSDRSDRRDLQNENQRVTEVGFRARVGLKRPKRPVIHARFAVPQGVICAPPAPKRPRARACGQVVVSFKRGSGPGTARTATRRPGAGVSRTAHGTSYGGRRMAITGVARRLPLVAGREAPCRLYAAPPGQQMGDRCTSLSTGAPGRPNAERWRS